MPALRAIDKSQNGGICNLLRYDVQFDSVIGIQGGSITGNKQHQHTVPKVYLKNFSLTEGKGRFLYTYLRKNRDIKKCSIKDIAVEKNFYTLSDVEDKDVWENFYAEAIEPLYTEIFPSLTLNVLRDRSIVLDTKIKSKLALLMCCQLCRGRSAREYVEVIAKNTVSKAKEDVRVLTGDTNDEWFLHNMSEDLLKHCYAVASTDPYYMRIMINSMLYNKCWILYRISGDACFITSDNPVVFKDERNNNLIPFTNGLNNPHTVVSYPISSKELLEIYDVRSMACVTSLNDQLVILNSEKEKGFIDLSNLNQVKQCCKQAFSQNEDTLRKAVENADNAY